MNEYNQKQISKINSFFETLHSCLDSQRNSILEELVHHQEDSAMKLSMIEQKLVQFLSEMKNIKDDIEGNAENILRNMEYEPLSEILNRYQCKLSEYSEAYEIVKSNHIHLLKAKVPQSTSPSSEVLQEIETWLQSWIELKEGRLHIFKGPKRPAPSSRHSPDAHSF